MAKCPEYARLESAVENVLGNLAQVTTIALQMFRAGDYETVKRLDKELELTIGKKSAVSARSASTSRIITARSEKSRH